MPGEQVRPAKQAKEEGHNSIGNLLCAADIDVEEATEAEISGKGGVDRAVGGAETEDELPGAKPALRGAGEEGEGMEEDGGGRLDLGIGETAERNVLDGGDAS